MCLLGFPVLYQHHAMLLTNTTVEPGKYTGMFMLWINPRRVGVGVLRDHLRLKLWYPNCFRKIRSV
ncbi:uncharacterized protein TRIVIDRAFT_216052 [Trichoderma virens Gv29-8]|uniref:Uncharacterized protein n=1 Tax=Hypocrea virens (strain Gv29-8 / FGSC 10586) TaxID=413071 RepID=G9MR19_HYPVG|nr:uncharacterized protein TRIVIDRAFT_216052 [Trichoderma virens Gv29-8]EHK22546.1 hypothetical protein TRIVIDRAFT_216052 [Trichoderma virens Gv29-8]